MKIDHSPEAVSCPLEYIDITHRTTCLTSDLLEGIYKNINLISLIVIRGGENEKEKR